MERGREAQGGRSSSAAPPPTAASPLQPASAYMPVHKACMPVQLPTVYTPAYTPHSTPALSPLALMGDRLRLMLPCRPRTTPVDSLQNPWRRPWRWRDYATLLPTGKGPGKIKDLDEEPAAATRESVDRQQRHGKVSEQVHGSMGGSAALLSLMTVRAKQQKVSAPSFSHLAVQTQIGSDLRRKSLEGRAMNSPASSFNLWMTLSKMQMMNDR